LANAIEPRLTQHLPAIVPIEIARIFLRRTFWVRKPQYASPASFRRELPRQAMEFGSLSHKGQGERECLHVFNATKHAHVTESANLLLERIWSVEDQDLLMVFEFSLSKVVGIVLWILQGVNGHVAVTLRYSGHITVQGRSIHLELRRNVLPRHFIRAQQRANGFQLLRA